MGRRDSSSSTAPADGSPSAASAPTEEDGVGAGSTRRAVVPRRHRRPPKKTEWAQEVRGERQSLGDTNIHQRRYNGRRKCETSGSPPAISMSSEEDRMCAGSAKRAAVHRRHQCPPKKTKWAHEVRDERQSLGGIDVHRRRHNGCRKCETSVSLSAASTFNGECDVYARYAKRAEPSATSTFTGEDRVCA